MSIFALSCQIVDNTYCDFLNLRVSLVGFIDPFTQ